jgi:hypothetical protein
VNFTIQFFKKTFFKKEQKQNRMAKEIVNFVFLMALGPHCPHAVGSELFLKNEDRNIARSLF